MNPNTLRYRDFWDMASRAAGEPHGHGPALLADWIEDHESDPVRAHVLRHGVPEHVLGRHGPQYTPFAPEPGGLPGVILRDEGRHVRPLVGRWNPATMDSAAPLAEWSAVARHGTAAPTPVASGPEHMALYRAEPTAGGSDRLVVRYTLRLPGGRALRLVAPVGHDHVRQIADSMREDDPRRAAWELYTSGHEDRATPLARTVAGAPAGGMIVNNRYARGGQFMEKTRARIRDVAAKLTQLARAPKPFEADLSAKGMFGRAPHADDRPLTLGELKAIEDEHKLPNHQRLSKHVTQSADATGDEHPYRANTEDIRWFIHHVSRARLPEPRVRTLLADKSLPSGAKLTHLLANMQADYEAANKGADGSGGSWYHGQINELERHLHSLSGGKDHPLWGSMDPATGELKGKHDPGENHPGVVLFKAILAATSGMQNPEKNTLSAAKLWAAGRRRGHPIMDAPDYNTDALAEWVAAVKRAHKISPTNTEHDDAIRRPGTTDAQRARWYNTWVRPHAAALDNEAGGAPAGYSQAEARINPDHTIHREHDGKKWVDKGGANVRGVTYTANLPLVDAHGMLAPKGWGARKEQVAGGLSSLKALFLVSHELNPKGTEPEHFRWVAKWLLNDHDEKEFADISARAEKYRAQLPNLHDKPFDFKKHGKEGWFAKRDRQKGTAAEPVPGMFILGPKFGAFGINLNSNHPDVAKKFRRFLTADLWFSRNWARYLGQMFRGPKKEEFEAPKPNDRRQMAVAIRALCDRLGVHPADLQADLWYHEQALYRMLGANAERTVSTSYGIAGNKYLNKQSPDLLRDVNGKPIKLKKVPQ